MPSNVFYGEIRKGLTFRSRNFYGCQVSKFRVQGASAGPKDSGSQNFSFLALKAEAVGEVQIWRTATVRDRRIFFIAQTQIMLFIHKKS
jgi:hypothetical protein